MLKRRPLTPLLIMAYFLALFMIIPLSKNSAAIAYFLGFMELAALVYGLNLITGMAGYVSFGQIVFHGIGAYVVAVLLLAFGKPPFSAFFYVLPAGAVAALVAYGLGLLILRLRGAYFAVATIGVNESVRVLISNIRELGEAEGIPLSRFLSYELVQAYYFMLAILASSMLLNYVIRWSRLGYSLLAIKEDEDAAEAMGIDTQRAKLIAFSLSGAATGAIGAAVGLVSVYVYPEAYFSIFRSTEMLVALLIGGAGFTLGPLAGTLVYYVVRDYFLVKFAYLHLVIFGAAFMMVILIFPEGILGILRRHVRPLRSLLT